MLKIAIPQYDKFVCKSIKQLQAAGVKFSLSSISPILNSNNFPAQISLMAYYQIISSVNTGIQDIGIVGEQHIKESLLEMNVVHRFSHKNSLSLFIGKEQKYNGLEYFAGKKIATPFPNICSKFFKEKNIKALIINCPQNTQNAIELNIADAVMDINFEGNFMFKEVEQIMLCSPVIIASAPLSPTKQLFLDELLERLYSVQNSTGKKYLLVRAKAENSKKLQEVLVQFDECLAVTPDIYSQNVCFQLVIDEKQFWDIKTHLQTLGAERLMLQGIENLI